VKQNNAARQAGHTKKRYKGLDQPPRYVSPTLAYNYHRDYSLKPGEQVSILTLEGRVVVPYTGYIPATTSTLPSCSTALASGPPGCGMTGPASSFTSS
jgi:hypothetical protein